MEGLRWGGVGWGGVLTFWRPRPWYYVDKTCRGNLEDALDATLMTWGGVGWGGVGWGGVLTKSHRKRNKIPNGISMISASHGTHQMTIFPHGEIWAVNLVCLSRKVAPEGLPWVLLYEVKGRAASPVTWFIRRLLVILVLPPAPPKSLLRTLRADSKHCNLQYFCSFRIKKPHFATWWNLRKY